MQRTICSRCKKNIAVIFITKIENGQSTNEGLCLKCAKELKIKPVEDIIRKMGDARTALGTYLSYRASARAAPGPFTSA